MGRRKGVRPEQYAGVYQSFGEVPDRYRLSTYSDQYTGKDTWGAYVEEVLKPQHEPLSENMETTIRLAGGSWLQHMESVGRHHALARPVDVELWCESLLSGRTVQTVYEYYFVRVYQFYEYLVSVKSHPHVYNPCLLAAIDGGAARRVWRYRIESRSEVVDRE